jgi:hypothetical protein
MITAIDRGSRAVIAADRAIQESNRRTMRQIAKETTIATSAYRRFAQEAEDSGRRLHTTLDKNTRATRALSRGIEYTVRGMHMLDGSMSKVNAGLQKFYQRFQQVRAILFTLRIPALVAGFGFLVQALGAAAGAAVSLVGALRPLAGALVALPAAAGVAAQAMATLKLAFGGVEDTIKAYDRQLLGSARNSVTAAKAQEALADSLRNAERRMRDAKQASQKAEEDLTRARRDALRSLNDMRLAAEGAANAEASASLRLRQARVELERVQNDPNATGFDREAAAGAVDDATLAMKQARIERQRAAKDFATADKAGVKGSDDVRNALRQQRDAAESVADATRELAAAQRDMAAGPRAAGAEDRYSALFERLSKEGKEFVTFWNNDVYKVINDTLQPAAGKNLFPGLIDGLKSLRGNLNPMVKVLEATGGAFGNLARDAGKLFGSKEFGAMFEKLGMNNVGVISKFGDSLLKLVNSFTKVMVAAMPFTNWLTDTITKWANLKAKAMGKWAEGDGAVKYFKKVREILTVVTDTLGNLGRAMGDIFAGATPMGESFLKKFEKTTQKWADWTSSAEGKNSIAQYFKDIKPAADALFSLFGKIVESMVRMSADSGVAQLIKAIEDELLPAFETFVTQSTRAFGPHLVGLLSSLAKLFTELAGPFGVVLSGLSKFADLLTIVANLPGVGTLFKVITTAVLAVGAVKFLATITGLRKIISYLGIASKKWQEYSMAGAAAVSPTMAAGLISKPQGLPPAPTAPGRGGAMQGAVTTPAGYVLPSMPGARYSAPGAPIIPGGSTFHARGALPWKDGKPRGNVPAGGAYLTPSGQVIPFNERAGLPVSRAGGYYDERGRRVATARGRPTLRTRLKGGRGGMAARGAGAVGVAGTAAFAASMFMPDDASASTKNIVDKAAMGGMVAAMLPLTAIFSKVGGAAKAMVGGLKLLSPAFMALRVAAMSAVAPIAALGAPILLTIAAVAAAGVAIYIFRDKIRAGLSAVVGFFKTHFDTIKKIVIGLTAPLWLPVVVAMAAASVAIRVAFAVMRGIFQAGFAVIRTILRVAVAALRVAWAVVEAALINPIRAGLRLVRTVLGGLGRIVSGAARTAISALGSAWGAVSDTFVNPVRTGIDRVTDFLGGLGRRLGDVGGEIAGFLLDGIVEGFKAGASFGRDIVAGLAGIIDEALPNTGPIPNNPIRDALGINYRAGGFVVPGSDRVDGTPAWLSGNEVVLTYSGQEMLDRVAPGLLGSVVDAQAPHFQAGGFVGARKFASGGAVNAARAARKAGLSGTKLVEAVAIAGPESRYNPTARLNTSVEDSRGLWQINTKAHPWSRSMNLYDPYTNARAMMRVSGGGRNWSPWSGYTGPDGRGSDGPWRAFIATAREAVKGTRIGVPKISDKGPAQQKRERDPKTPMRPLSAMEKRLKLRGASPPSGFYEAAFAGQNTRSLFDDQISGYSQFDSFFGSQEGAAPSTKKSDPRKPKTKVTNATKYPTVSGGYRSGKGLPDGGGTPAPAGAANWRGKPVAPWIWHQLNHLARTTGFVADVNEGWRSYATQKKYWDNAPQMGLIRGKTVAVPGQSNHGGLTWPKGAVDVTNWPGLKAILGKQQKQRKKLSWFGPADAVHFSATGHRKGKGRRGLRKLKRVSGSAGGFKGIPGTMKDLLYDPMAEVDALAMLGTKGIATQKLSRENFAGVVQENAAMYGGNNALNAIQGAITDRLQQLLNGPQSESVKKQVAALQEHLSTVQAGLDTYFGRVAGEISRASSTILDRTTALTRSFRVAGIDESSSGAQAAMAALFSSQVTALKDQSNQLQELSSQAARAGRADVVTAIQEQIKQLNETAAEIAVQAIEAARNAAYAAAAEGVGAAERATARITTLQQRQELEQKLAKTFDTAGGRIARADFIRNNVIGSLQNEITKLEAQAQTFEQFGNAKEAEAVRMQIEEKRNAILAAQLEAQELIEANTKEAADALKELTGSVAFEVNGQRFTDDLAGIGNGL